MAVGIFIVSYVQKSVRPGLMFSDPPKQLQDTVVAVIPEPANDQMRLSVQVARNMNKSRWRISKRLYAALDRVDEIVLTRLEDG